MYQVLEVVRKEMNFSYTLVELQTMALGAKQKNGSWNGAIASLQRKEIDLTIMDVTVLKERAEVQKSLMVPDTCMQICSNSCMKPIRGLPSVS